MFKIFSLDSSEGFVFKRFTIIYVIWGNHEIQKFSAFVAYEM